MRILPLALLVYDSPGGNLLYDWSLDAANVRLSESERGHESLSWSVEMRMDRAFRVYDGLTAPYVLLTSGDHAWEGRLEDKQVTGRGLELTAMGYWRAISDYGPYNALWSDTSVARWQTLTNGDISTAKPERFEADNNNRLWIAARNGEAFVNTDRAAWGYRIPDRSSRNIVVIQFAYEFGSGSNVQYRLAARPADWSGAGTSLFALNAAGAIQTGAQYLTFAGSPSPALTFELVITGAQTIAAATGSTASMKITRLRVATTTTNNVSTTIAVNILAGAQTVTPASMVGIYVGQELVVTGTGSVGEIVTVTAITSTTFNATFALGHTASVTVKGIVTYASEITQDIVAKVSTLNPAQLSASTAGIEATSRDLLLELYEEKTAQDIIGYLADEGDDTRQEVGVWGDRRLFFRDRGSRARTWYTDVIEVELASTLNTLTNQAYAVFRRANGGLQRTDSADDAHTAKYGIVRRGFIAASTTSQTQAEAQRDAYLAGRSTITPRSRVATEGLFDAAGIEYPLWMLRAGDVMVLRNLPPTLGTSADKIRRFRVARKTYDVGRDELHPTPELELPGLDVMISRPQIKQVRQGVKADYALPTLAAVDTV